MPAVTLPNRHRMPFGELYVQWARSDRHYLALDLSVPLPECIVEAAGEASSQGAMLGIVAAGMDTAAAFSGTTPTTAGATGAATTAATTAAGAGVFAGSVFWPLSDTRVRLARNAASSAAAASVAGLARRARRGSRWRRV